MLNRIPCSTYLFRHDVFVVFQETVDENMTVLERKNLRRAMYSREALKTEEEVEGKIR